MVSGQLKPPGILAEFRVAQVQCRYRKYGHCNNPQHTAASLLAARNHQQNNQQSSKTNRCASKCQLRWCPAARDGGMKMHNRCGTAYGVGQARNGQILKPGGLIACLQG